MGKTILFVYGTLKRGNSANHRLDGQRFVGEAMTEPRYHLFEIGPYSGLVTDEANGLAVIGELWEVDERCLAELDGYEGAPGLYVREGVAVRGVADPVEAYFYAGPVPPAARSGASWPFPAGG